ncbi:MAG: DMT family transporter, partial [Phyllobacterium sp.]
LLIQPENGAFDMILLLPLSCAVLFGFYVIATRKVSRDDSAMTSFFYTGLAGAAAISFVGPFYWTQMRPEDWLWTLSICVTGALSHYLLIKAYDLLDAVAVQPLTYLQIVFAAAIGAAIFGETLSLNTVLGSVIITIAGIFTVWRETLAIRRGKPKN